MTAVPETHSTTPVLKRAKRHDATVGGGLTSGLLGRVRVALGGRDIRGEIAAYRLALPSASDAQVASIVDQLLELVETPHGAEALQIVAGVFERLEPGKRERALVMGHGLWGRALTGAAIDVDPSVRLSVATLIGRACDPDTFTALRGLLSDRDERVAERAGQSLVMIAERSMRAPALDGSTRVAIEATVSRAANEFDKHRRREALGALLAVCSTPAAMKAASVEIKSWLSDAEHPAHMALRGLFRRGDALASREQAWLWLARPEERTACLERLSFACDADGYERVLTSGHLACNPWRSTALRGSIDTVRRGKASGLMPDEGTIERLGSKAAATLPRWAACIGREGLEQRLESLLGTPIELARINALRTVADECPGTDLALDFCFDADPRIARSATVRIGTPAWRETLGHARVLRSLRALARSEHASVRDAAAAARQAIDPFAEEHSGRLAARRMLRGDRTALVSTLQTRLRTGTLAERLGSIRLAARLGLGAELELELLTLVGQSVEIAASQERSQADTNVLFAAASAVGLLAELASPAAQHALHRCLHHADGRIRANALDALTRTARRRGSIHAKDSPLSAVAVEFKDDPHHRVRAGAARARLLAAQRTDAPAGGADAGPAPTIMPLLTDSRPMHRVSGLWLAERAPGGEQSGTALATTVAEIVRTDPEPEVRIRARLTAARLLAKMRGGWSDRAADVH